MTGNGKEGREEHCRDKENKEATKVNKKQKR